MDTLINNKTYRSLQSSSSVNLKTNLLSFNVFYSLKLKDYNQLFNIRFNKVNTARLAVIIINHLNNNHRNIQNDFCRLYGIRPQTAAFILKELLSRNLIIPVNCKRKTNLGLFVSFTAYQITFEGKCVATEFDELISIRMTKLN